MEKSLVWARAHPSAISQTGEPEYEAKSVLDHYGEWEYSSPVHTGHFSTVWLGLQQRDSYSLNHSKEEKQENTEIKADSLPGMNWETGERPVMNFYILIFAKGS